MDLGDKRLRVQKASIGITQVAGVEMGVNAMSMLAGTTSTDAEESRVLQLLNMVTPEELMDNDDYEGKRLSDSQQDTYINSIRNLRRCTRRMLQVRHHHWAEGTTTSGWQQTVGGCRQDLRQVRHHRICDEGPPGIGRKEVCG
jgi:hypothetical protein